MEFEGSSLQQPLLANSISSFGSAASQRHQVSHVSKTYRQASALFLTRRLAEALSTLLPIITPITLEVHDDAAPPATEPAPVTRASRSSRVKVWTLYIATLNAIVALEPYEGKEAFGAQDWRVICSKVRDGLVWEEVVRDGYHGVEGDVDPDVVINLATLLLAHAKDQKLNQLRLENYLAASTTPNLDLTGRFPPSTSLSRRPSTHRRPSSRAGNGTDTPRDLDSRVKILELYTLHVLLRNDEWDYARDFIGSSGILDEERREAFLQALQSLHDDRRAVETEEREEQMRREEQLEREVEASRRERREAEERERKRIGDLEARRKGGPVDQGMDPPVPGQSRRRVSPSDTDRTKPVGRPTARIPETAGARALMAMSNLRSMLERMAMSLFKDPTTILRFVIFLTAIVLTFGKRRIRERLSRIMGTSWGKVKATAGMGTKITYI